MSHTKSPLVQISQAQKQWKSLEELSDAAAFEERVRQEFPVDTDLLPDTGRRRFLQFMAASLALGGATSCRPPTETILPYVNPPEQIIPGQPLFFATATLQNGFAQGVLVESHMGRPTKIQGNPQHPASRGATDAVSQAAVLTLYDPDRSRGVRGPEGLSSWPDFQMAMNRLMSAHAGARGAGLRILTQTITSPTLAAQIAELLSRYPEARWHQYEATGGHAVRAGTQMAFGRMVNPVYSFDKADVILSLDSEFLTCGPAATRYAMDFANRRRVRSAGDSMNRLYALESTFTATGGRADHRWPVRWSDMERVAEQIAAAVGSAGGNAGSGVLPREIVEAIARDLLAHRGGAVVVPGDTQTPRLHAIAHSMNATLGSAGTAVAYTDPVEFQATDQIASLRQLVSEMNAGAVHTLVIIGGNPAYDTPHDLGFVQALGKVAARVHLGLYDDETARVCDWHLPQAHSLETWSDARAFDGTVTILQPLIAPLFGGRSAHELLEVMLGRTARSYDIVRAYWRAQNRSGDFESWWRKSVHDGLVENSAAVPVNLSAGAVAPRAGPASSGLELTFRPDPYILDGSLANNAWLQELPRPMTKLTWDNALLVSPTLAKRLGVWNHDVVEVEANGATIDAPVWVAAGQPEESLTIALGFGRSRAGSVGTGRGVNAYALRTSQTLWQVPVIAVRRRGRTYPLASTQTHNDMADRPLVISDTVERLKRDPKFAEARSHAPEYDNTLYPHWPKGEYAWGMAIDLSVCVNCNACVAACQSENNIAVVGKEQVLASREMHWLRIDTYYEGNPANPKAHYQPLPCMHCEYAPCELVCPTHATVHSSDGLNDMVYNRCIGTRYCSNNCPYKVRHFNFLDYARKEETLRMMRNPDVTVRSRGVMEKCTYCVQRIREAEILARKENRLIRDGEVQTACQEVCPTRAIQFGNIADPNSRVSQWKRTPTNYSLLAELNTRPRTTYLAEIRNPNPQIEART